MIYSGRLRRAIACWDEVSDILQVRLLSFTAEVSEASGLARAIEEFGGSRCFHRSGCGNSPQYEVLSGNGEITPIIPELDRKSSVESTP
ncbi:hypothetical protein CKA32_000545 [Geitlerinema sp. FC II]|nr:hypothetical protein CKA32_000545 [Geitlerinema sp. FC II]